MAYSHWLYCQVLKILLTNSFSITSQELELLDVLNSYVRSIHPNTEIHDFSPNVL